MTTRITIWQCKDECCEDKAHSSRYWLARSQDFEFYEQVSTWDTAMTLTDSHLRISHLRSRLQ